MLINAGSVSVGDLKSEGELIKALQQIGDLNDGEYSVHLNSALFARFDVTHKKIRKLHRASKHTGIVMPCWNYFKEQGCCQYGFETKVRNQEKS